MAPRKQGKLTGSPGYRVVKTGVERLSSVLSTAVGGAVGGKIGGPRGAWLGATLANSLSTKLTPRVLDTVAGEVEDALANIEDRGHRLWGVARDVFRTVGGLGRVRARAAAAGLVPAIRQIPPLYVRQKSHGYYRPIKFSRPVAAPTWSRYRQY